MISYLKARLVERSTWSDIIVTIAAAAVLPPPWSHVTVLIGVVKALVPDGPVTK
jgi:hypothetical protein